MWYILNLCEQSFDNKTVIEIISKFTVDNKLAIKIEIKSDS